MIPFDTPDVALWATSFLRTQLSGESVRVSTQKFRTTGTYKEIVVSVSYGTRVTDITRNCLITLEVWVMDDGTADLGGAFALANRAAYLIESHAPASPLVIAEVNTGPNEVSDPLESGHSFHEVVIGCNI